MIENRSKELAALLDEQLNTAIDAQAKISRLQNEIDKLSRHMPNMILDLEALRQMESMEKNFMLDEVFNVFRVGDSVRDTANILINKARYQRSLLHTLSLFWQEGGNDER